MAVAAKTDVRRRKARRDMLVMCVFLKISGRKVFVREDEAVAFAFFALFVAVPADAVTRPTIAQVVPTAIADPTALWLVIAHRTNPGAPSRSHLRTVSGDLNGFTFGSRTALISANSIRAVMPSSSV